MDNFWGFLKTNLVSVIDGFEKEGAEEGGIKTYALFVTGEAGETERGEAIQLFR